MALNLERYQRQLALPDISVADQHHLATTRIAIIGAGGLGCASLPYLAAAGIGHITIIDHDTVSRSNLHRQTLFKDSDIGQSKAELAAAYCQDLNPDITVTAITERFDQNNTHITQDHFDLIIDGSDNFETKTALNTLSIQHKTPLISASVNQWAGQIGIFAGYAKDKPCYHCLFPELPTDARNCNEAGILGTAAGITGLYQAHLILCYLIGIEDFEPGHILNCDYKTLRVQSLTLHKDKTCAHCANANDTWTHSNANNQKQDAIMTELITMQDLTQKAHIIVDVRTDDEVLNDPIPAEDGKLIHMELQTVPARHEELPKDTLLAFVCAGNVRSVQAAEYLKGIGYDNICVLDKFSIR